VIWTRAPSERPPNVLLISIDTLSREHLSAYGYSQETTPVLDRLAAEGAMFTDAVSTTNWTLPAQLSAMSGLSPAAHRVQDKPDSLPRSVRMLAESFREQGAATAAFVSHIYLDRRYGFDRGFDEFDNAQDQKAVEVTRKAAEWLARHGDDRFFLFVHYFDPHWKLEPPRPFQERFAPAGVDLDRGEFEFLFPHFDPRNPMSAETLEQVTGLYDAEVSFTDYSVGLLIDYLEGAGVLDDTIVVVFSDHGEEIGEHGAFGHGTHLYDEIVGIPLIVRYPARIPGGTVVRTPSALTDIPATILALAGIDPPEQFLEEGSALIPRKGQPHALADRVRVVESSRWGPKRFAVMRGGYKLMTAGIYQPLAFNRLSDGEIEEFRMSSVIFPERLYRASDDPGEQTDLLAGDASEEHRRIATELRRELRAFLEANSASTRIVCAGSPEDGPSFEGTVQISGTLRDEPFGFPPQSGTVIRKLDRGGFRFVLDDVKDLAGVVIPLMEPDASLTLSLMRDGDEIYSGEIMIPAPGVTLPLGPDAAGCTVTTPVPRHSAGSEDVDLTAEQLDTLRSLGYVE
jgi:arylsulfatase